MSTTTSKSSESISLLIDSVRVARETEELANDTLDEIREQKTLLHRAWGNMRGMMDTTWETEIVTQRLASESRSKTRNLWMWLIGLCVLNVILMFRIIDHGRIL